MFRTFKSFGLYYRTLKHLKLVQVIYRVRYFIRNKTNWNKTFRTDHNPSGFQWPHLLPGIPSKPALVRGTFTFIGISHRFVNQIEWNFMQYGKLWCYNLNYFDFLGQENFDKGTGIGLMLDFIRNCSSDSVGLEPYPTSLRGMNWIRFISKHNIRETLILKSLFNQYEHLCKNIEYHILGNHLLENGFSLFHAGCFFSDPRFRDLAKKILVRELDEQILSDGAHFELSPMYHQIMLNRLLDCINIQGSVPEPDPELTVIFHHQAQKMAGWLKKITWQDGNVPRVNDTTGGIAPETAGILDFAGRLNLKILENECSQLGECGYRKFCHEKYALFMDVGNIGPDYIPGHAHSDTFSFELFINQTPFLVDTGISTYECNSQRQIERSTHSHNTVMFNNIEQTEIWASHRVGRRAKVKILKESEGEISAQHDGYQRSGAIHTRTFRMYDRNVVIDDRMDGASEKLSVAFFHFFPGVAPLIADQEIITPLAKLKFEGSIDISLKNYDYARGFNDLSKAVVAEITFGTRLKTTIAF
jgi:hypothetical protein